MLNKVVLFTVPHNNRTTQHQMKLSVNRLKTRQRNQDFQFYYKV